MKTSTSPKLITRLRSISHIGSYKRPNTSASPLGLPKLNQSLRESGSMAGSILQQLEATVVAKKVQFDKLRWENQALLTQVRRLEGIQSGKDTHSVEELTGSLKTLHEELEEIRRGLQNEEHQRAILQHMVRSRENTRLSKDLFELQAQTKKLNFQIQKVQKSARQREEEVMALKNQWKSLARTRESILKERHQLVQSQFQVYEQNQNLEKAFNEGTSLVENQQRYWAHANAINLIQPELLKLKESKAILEELKIIEQNHKLNKAKWASLIAAGKFNSVSQILGYYTHLKETETTLKEQEQEARDTVNQLKLRLNQATKECEKAASKQFTKNAQFSRKKEEDFALTRATLRKDLDDFKQFLQKLNEKLVAVCVTVSRMSWVIRPCVEWQDCQPATVLHLLNQCGHALVDKHLYGINPPDLELTKLGSVKLNSSSLFRPHQSTHSISARLSLEE